MANRGRGRGKASMSISSEQLGFGKGDALPPPVLQPPAKYPLLEYKPTPFELTSELSYLLEIKRDFAEYIRESPSNVQSIVVKKDIERYSDRYQDMVSDKVSYEDRYDWNRLPLELKPGLRKRKSGKSDKDTLSTKTKKKKKKTKDVDIEKKLEELEQKEDTQQSDVEEENKTEEDGEEKDENEPAEGEEAEEMDEEMEDDTDYVNNYFDNGEGYDDDEDNLDEGPIY